MERLQCSVNHHGCQGKAEQVCHHCGRLLCENLNCCLWAWDSAFRGRSVAYHCPECDHLHLPGRMLRTLINWWNDPGNKLRKIAGGHKENNEPAKKKMDIYLEPSPQERGLVKATI